MKILYLDQTGQLGGAELSMLDIVANMPFPGQVALFSDGPFRQALESAGAAVSILSGNGVSGVRREDGLRAVLRAVPGLFALRRQVSTLARSADIVYANTQKAFVVAALATQAPPLVWHLRDMLTASHFSPVLRRFVVALANRRAAAVIANSAATRGAFVEAGGRADLVSVVHNGISPEVFDSLDDDTVRHLRADLAPQGAFLVGVFGRLSPWKGQHVLLDALEQLPPDVHGVVVGDALFGERDYAAEMQTRAASGTLRGRVHLLGFRKDIPALMKAMDVIAHTSVAPEPFGRVIVEGMLAGRPVVASAAGGALEIVENSVSGMLVPPGDAVALAAALGHLQRDPERRAQLITGGTKRARESFSLPAMLAGVKQVFERTADPVPIR